MEAAISVISAATGKRPVLIRFPYSEASPAALEERRLRGLTVVKWTVNSEDWHMPGPEKIVENVLTRARNGELVLMHDGGGDRSQTVAALRTLIPKLKEKGFRLVTVSEVLRREAVARAKPAGIGIQGDAP